MTATTDRTATPDTALAPAVPRPARGRPDINPEPSSTFERVLVALFVAVPFLAIGATLYYLQLRDAAGSSAAT